MIKVYVLAAALNATLAAAMPTGEALEETIADLDARLFWAAFEGCDAEALAPLLGEGYRMVHDEAGLAVPGREQFIQGIADGCAARLPGGANEGYKNRRLLTPGSRRVQALGDWGALEEGHHSFYELQSDGSWRLTGGGRYIHLWRWSSDHFVLDESISIDHGAARSYPPNAASSPEGEE